MEAVRTGAHKTEALSQPQGGGFLVVRGLTRPGLTEVLISQSEVTYEQWQNEGREVRWSVGLEAETHAAHGCAQEA